jgi:dolichol-phosphate mannosyltransferase
MNSSPQLSTPELAIVMPVYNEAANIGSVLEEWFGHLRIACPNFVLFAVNDGSTDDTAEILASLKDRFGSRLRVVNKINGGHGSACREGYELALGEEVEWILQIDSDGQCDPVFFNTLYRNRAKHDCLFGYRRTRDDGIGRLIISHCCRLLLWMVTGARLRDPNVPYRLMRTRVLRNAIRNIPADFKLQNIALSVALSRAPGLRWKYLPIHFRARQGGKNSISCWKIAKMGIECLRELNRLNHEDSDSWRRSRWARRRVAS